mmetsp:Transcript_26981/g.31090  ORF Transcript_26981/g.31090 Transcript_26981/m.31090 type:complete len:257 (+) Transcript_26981:46-816(+)
MANRGETFDIFSQEDFSEDLQAILESTTFLTSQSGHNQNTETAEDLIREHREKAEQLQGISNNLHSRDERKWLKKHGKSRYIDFDDLQRSKLKRYFTALDEDGSGSIGIEELEEPLIALGLAETKEQVMRIIEEVDDDGSGTIEFEEFLSIIKNKHGKEHSPMYDLFQNMMRGNLEGVDNTLPFKMVYTNYRRRKMIDALMSDDSSKRVEGGKVLKAYKRQLYVKKKEERRQRDQLKETYEDLLSNSSGSSIDLDT